MSCRSEFLQYSTSGWRHFSCHFPPVLQCNSFFPPLLSPPFFPRRLQYVAVWIVCYYPAGDNIITTYLLSRVCKEWCCLGPQWSNNLTQGSRITHSWLGEVKHYQLERGVNKREVPPPPLPPPPLLSPSLVNMEGDTPPLRQTQDAILPRLGGNICLVQGLYDTRLQGGSERAACATVRQIVFSRCSISVGWVSHNFPTLVSSFCLRLPLQCAQCMQKKQDNVLQSIIT